MRKSTGYNGNGKNNWIFLKKRLNFTIQNDEKYFKMEIFAYLFYDFKIKNS